MKPVYFYVLRGRMWVVYRYNDATQMSATKVKACFTKEEARDEVYRLNGWKMQSKFFHN